MPKHPVPKKRTARATTKTRYTAFVKSTQKKLANTVNLVKCPNCGATKLNHHVCKDCGQYKGNQILSTEKAVNKAVTKIKA